MTKIKRNQQKVVYKVRDRGDEWRIALVSFSTTAELEYTTKA